jgi:hypothetical protein
VAATVARRFDISEPIALVLTGVALSVVSGSPHIAVAAESSWG